MHYDKIDPSREQDYVCYIVLRLTPPPKKIVESLDCPPPSLRSYLGVGGYLISKLTNS